MIRRDRTYVDILEIPGLDRVGSSPAAGTICGDGPQPSGVPGDATEGGAGAVERIGRRTGHFDGCRRHESSGSPPGQLRYRRTIAVDAAGVAFLAT